MPDTTDTTRTITRNGARAQPPSASIFRNRNFILLWCAYTTSALGDHLSEMALLDMQEATLRNDSTRISAIIMFSFMLPFFLFGPAMGWLADRLPRKWIMISADAIRAVLMISLAAILGLLANRFADTGWEVGPSSDGRSLIFSPWLYAMPLMLTGVFAALFSPARAAMLPTLIRTDQIVRGNGLMNAMGPIATIASFLLGGFLVGHFGTLAEIGRHFVVREGVLYAFRIDAITFLASAGLLLLIRPPVRKPMRTSQHRCEQRPTINDQPKQDSLIDGLKYCRSHRRVIELIVFTVLFWSAAGVVRSIIPALVGHVFGGGTEHIGYYTAALGIGMLCGAMLLAFFGDALRSEIAVSWSLVGAGLAASWLAAVYQFKIGMFAGYSGLFFTGMFGSGILVSANALLQKVVPDFFRGRVFGVKDVASIAGLLVATGILAIPRWQNIDQNVPLLLLAVGATLFIGGIVTKWVRLSRGSFSPAITFWRNVAEFHARLMARVRRDGPCTVPRTGPVILAANHSSTIDPFLLTATSPNRYPSFMIAREYAAIPVFRRLVNLIDCIPVNRSGIDTASVKASLRHLATGRVLGVFPQGGVQPPDQPPKIQDGIGMLALRSGAAVIPVHISGLRFTDAIVTPFLRRHRAVVRYGPPVDLSQWKGREKDRTAYRECAEHIMDRINALKPQ